MRDRKIEECWTVGRPISLWGWEVNREGGVGLNADKHHPRIQRKRELKTKQKKEPGSEEKAGVRWRMRAVSSRTVVGKSKSGSTF